MVDDQSSNSFKIFSKFLTTTDGEADDEILHTKFTFACNVVMSCYSLVPYRGRAQIHPKFLPITCTNLGPLFVQTHGHFSTKIRPNSTDFVVRNQGQFVVPFFPKFLAISQLIRSSKNTIIWPGSTQNLGHFP